MIQAAVLAAGALLAFPAFSGEPLTGRASVIDGDTIEIQAPGSAWRASTRPRAGRLACQRRQASWSAAA